MDTTTENPSRGLPKLDLTWDTNTATAAIVLGSLVFLIAVRRGFRGVNIGGTGL